MKSSAVPMAMAVAAHPAPAESVSRAGAVAYLLLTALMLTPLLWVPVPPLVDYPNHLARMWILVAGGKIPELAGDYIIHWRLVPNLAMDLVIPALARVMPLEVAGRVFIGLTMLGLAGGTLALHRALHGRTSLWPACALLFIYNAALFWGFLNFLCGLALFFLLFSGWIATREWRTPPRLFVFSLAAAILLIFHLFAFGLYGLSVMSYEFGRRVQGWRLSRAAFLSLFGIGLQFIPALFLWWMSLSNSGPMFTKYGSWADKRYALLAPWTFSHQPLLLDKLTICFCAGFLAFAILTRSLKLVPEMRWPLWMMAAVAIAMPNWLSGSWAADTRLPIALPFIIIASTRLQSSHKRVIGLCALGAAMLFGVRIWSTTEAWRAYGREFAEFSAAAEAIRPGSRFLVVQPSMLPEDAIPLAGLPLAVDRRYGQVYWHMPALAVIERDAFFPYLFTGWTPVQPNPRNAGLYQTQSIPLTPEELRQGIEPVDPETWTTPNFLGELLYFRDWPKTFDYVLWIDFGHPPAAVPSILEPVSSGSFFRIYRIAKP